MDVNREVTEMAVAISRRSSCNVRMGAVVFDKRGVISWGWNNPGNNGKGMCAEEMAIRRAHRERLTKAKIVAFKLWVSLI